MAKTANSSPLLVRLPEPMKQWLRSRAKENSRSMSGEILQILKAKQGEEGLSQS